MEEKNLCLDRDLLGETLKGSVDGGTCSVMEAGVGIGGQGSLEGRLEATCEVSRVLILKEDRY